MINFIIFKSALTDMLIFQLSANVNPLTLTDNLTE